jgi:hypothetical protein
MHRINCSGLWRSVALQFETDLSEGHFANILNSEAGDGGSIFLSNIVINPRQCTMSTSRRLWSEEAGRENLYAYTRGVQIPGASSLRHLILYSSRQS